MRPRARGCGARRRSRAVRRVVTEAIPAIRRITVVARRSRRAFRRTDGVPTIVATGPLTSDALSADVAAFVGSDHLYFYDAVSPIVLAETIDRTKVFRASRWGRNVQPPRSHDVGAATPARGHRAGSRRRAACGLDDGQGDYLNCPLTARSTSDSMTRSSHAESATVHDFDNERFFEGCLPIEVMAHRGRDTLRFGPMKPVGLIDPRTGRQPYAAVQLRQDNLAGDHFSLVGFQTQIKWGDQARVLRLIPGLETAEFVRFGMVHRKPNQRATRARARHGRRARARSLLCRAGVRRRRVSRIRRLRPAGRHNRAFHRGDQLVHAAFTDSTTAIGSLAFTCRSSFGSST